MDSFKDTNCKIVNIHGRISRQTGVRVIIFSFCRCIDRETVPLQNYIYFQSMCTALCISANPRTNVKIDINSITDFQNMPQYISNK